MNDAVAQAQAAAASGVATGEAAATLGTTSGKLGFQLTLKALDEDTAIAVFPLLFLSLAAIAEGLAAYVATDVRAGLDLTEIRQAYRAAASQVQAGYARGQAHWKNAA